MKGRLLHIQLFSLLVTLLFAGYPGAFAQQQHFMYIQSDSKEPFGVSLDKKHYNSSNTGYLIIAKVASGPHSVVVRFPQKKYPAQAFDIVLDSVDAGFGLKNLGAKGWGLINLQTMKMVLASHTAQPAAGTATAAAPAKQPAAAPAGGGQFGDMLSQVVDDPTLKEAPVTNTPAATTVAAPPVVQSAPATPQPTATTAAHQPGKKPKPKPAQAPVTEEKPAAVTEAPTESAAGNAEEANTRGVIKATQESKNEGTQVTFLDFNSKSTDTVNIFIPKPDETTAVTDTATPVVQQPVAVAPAPPAKKKKERSSKPLFTDEQDSSKALSNPFYSPPKQPITATVQPAGNTTATDSTAATHVTTEHAAVNNSNCRELANENDLAKLRKRMVGAGNDDKMIEVARRAFKSKCYNTEQIKALGMLFYTDETRYRFYDAGYPFVYDVANYISLENMLIDDYYKKRFRAMLRL